MSLSLSNSGHTLVMESLKLGPRVKLFESFSSLNASTLGPSLRDSITEVWPEMERLSHIFAVTPFSIREQRRPRSDQVQTLYPTLSCHSNPVNDEASTREVRYLPIVEGVVLFWAILEMHLQSLISR